VDELLRPQPDHQPSLSAPEQQLDFSYKMPLLKNPLEQYYLVQGGFKRTDLNDTEPIPPRLPALLGSLQRLAARH
jgi:outer membrane translocation and assembly module TamA